MSFLPFGGGGSSQQTINQQNVSMLEQEYEAITETFNRIVESCFKKCIPPKYIEGELNKGESVCIDRCFSKYIDVTTKIGEALTKKGQEAGARAGGFGV